MNQERALPFSSGDALRFGWAKMKANLKPFLIIGAVGAFLALLNGALTRPESPAIARLLSIVVQILQTGVMLAYVRSALRACDGKPVEVSRAPDLLADFFTYLLASILVGLIVAAGFVLLIVPGIIWGLKFGFAGFLVVDRKLDPIEALRESNRLTMGAKWQLLAFALLVFGINLVGAIALGIGLLVTIPTTVIGAAYVFRQLQARATARVEPAPQRPPVPATPAPAH